MKYTHCAALAAISLSAVSPATAWESANDGGRLCHFVNGNIDFNMRAWPAPVSQIIATLSRGTQMSADRCIHPQGLPDDWCHVVAGVGQRRLSARDRTARLRRTDPTT